MDKPRTPGECRRVLALLRLARAEFGRLPWADKRVVIAAALGETADFEALNPENKNAWIQAQDHEQEITNKHIERITAGDTWTTYSQVNIMQPQITIYFRTLYWLLTNRSIVNHVHPNGIRITGCYFGGLLNFANSTILHPLYLRRCVIKGILLRRAVCNTINLNGSTIYESKMPGSESCAFNADSSNFQGDVFLAYGFKSLGKVRMCGARISGQLQCSGGRFLSNSQEYAIQADSIRVDTGVILKDGFRAEGVVSIICAEIKSMIVCSDAVFASKYARSFVADGATISNGFVIQKCCFEGEVRLTSVESLGNLEIENCVFSNAGKIALRLDKSRVHGILFLRYNLRIFGILDLCAAKVDILHDDVDIVLNKRPSRLNTFVILSEFDYGAIQSGSQQDANIRLLWLANHDNALVQIRPRMNMSPQPYHHLANLYKRQGHETDAKLIMYKYHKRRTLAQWENFLSLHPRLEAFALDIEHYFSRVTNFLSPAYSAISKCIAIYIQPLIITGFNQLYRAVVGYGYFHWRALGWLAAFVVLGALIFGYQGGRRMQPTQMFALREFESAWAQNVHGSNAHEGQSNLIERYPTFNALLYSADALIPLVSFHQEDYWTPRSDPDIHSIATWWTSKGWWSGRWWTKIYLAFHITMGWVIATLFAVSFTKLMRSD